ncbi:MAG: DUF3473 domain-containing protein [Bacteroidetes bacterium]|nr:DUF3473 domain-containing protein [Bacteroidota bacterium]
MLQKVPNFLTLDVEEWFDAELPRRRLSEPFDEISSIEKQIDLYIDICNRYQIRSTCFVVGKLAEKKPHIVKKLHEHGHEIASHSYGHKLVYSMKPEEFKEDLHRSVSILEALTGEKIKGFRAPSWSVTSVIADWFYATLEGENLLYSSSVFPAKTFLYGMPGANSNIHKAAGSSIIEIPQQLANLGIIKTGIAGGTYLRLLPAPVVQAFIRMKNSQGKPVFIYLHPWELLYQKYPVQLSFTENIIQYYGVKRNAAKIGSICESFNIQLERMDEFISSFLAQNE